MALGTFVYTWWTWACTWCICTCSTVQAWRVTDSCKKKNTIFLVWHFMSFVTNEKSFHYTLLNIVQWKLQRIPTLIAVSTRVMSRTLAIIRTAAVSSILTWRVTDGCKITVHSWLVSLIIFSIFCFLNSSRSRLNIISLLIWTYLIGYII